MYSTVKWLIVATLKKNCFPILGEYLCLFVFSFFLFFYHSGRHFCGLVDNNPSYYAKASPTLPGLLFGSVVVVFFKGK